MGSERDACVDDERLVISEVHIGSSAVEEEAEVVSRYTYLVPSDKTGDDDSSSCSSSDIDSDNNEGDATGRGSGSCSSPTRRRKRPRAKASSTTTTQRRSRPAHEVLTIVHRMATPLGLVGQQVWSAAFLLGDFVLTHPKIFAGVQVGAISVFVRGLALGGWGRAVCSGCPFRGLNYERESYNRTISIVLLFVETSKWKHRHQTVFLFFFTEYQKYSGIENKKQKSFVQQYSYAYTVVPVTWYAVSCCRFDSQTPNTLLLHI